MVMNFRAISAYRQQVQMEDIFCWHKSLILASVIDVIDLGRFIYCQFLFTVIRQMIAVGIIDI